MQICLFRNVAKDPDNLKLQLDYTYIGLEVEWLKRQTFGVKLGFDSRNDLVEDPHAPC